MAIDLDTLLRESAPEVPDPGDVRRLNRRSLAPLLTSRARRRRLGEQAAVVAVSLALVGMVFVGDLGSDSFEVTGEMAYPDAPGVQKILRLGERGQAVPLMEGWTEADAREFASQAYNDEGQLLIITGWKAPTAECWSMGFSSEMRGEATIRGRQPEGMPQRMDRGFLGFLLARGSRIGDDPDGMLGSPTGSEVLVIEGVPRTFKVWEFEDPEQGTLKYYRWEADR